MWLVWPHDGWAEIESVPVPLAFVAVVPCLGKPMLRNIIYIIIAGSNLL